MILELIVKTFWLMFPAYVVNSAAVFVGGGLPMDLGRKAKDGERYLGDGKTWRGFFGGTAVGMLVGLVQNWVAIQLPENGYLVPFSEDYVYALLVIALLSFGSMTGDAIGSYIKRRMKIPRGGKANLMDPLGFVIMAWVFVAVGAAAWFLKYMLLDVVPIVTMLVLTPIIHRITNVIGYKMGRKKVPW